MKKRVVPFVVVFLCLFPPAAFAGGGRQGGTQSSAALQELGFKESGFPIVNKPYTLRVLASQHQYNPNFDTFGIFQKMEAKTGVHIEWQYAGADWGTQKPLLLAAGDLPDVFLKNTLNESDVITNMELFHPLDNLIERYGTNIKAMFADNPKIYNLARAYDGHIYGLPGQMPARPDTYCVWGINSDWLKKLNLKAPATTEEFYQVLKAFKERDPNGNGKADEIPSSFIGGDQGNRGFMDLLCAFGIVADNDDQWLSVTNGKVQYIAVQEGFRDAVIYLRRLYAEGLIDQEIFTQNRNMLYAKANPTGNNPEILGVGSDWARTSIFGLERAKHYEVLLPLRGPGGHQMWRQMPETTKMGKYAFEITTACKNPEIALRWGDNLYDTATSLELFYGPLGTHLRAESGGGYTVLDEPAGYNGSHWIRNFAPHDQSPGYVSDRTALHIPEIVVQQLYDKGQLLGPYFAKEYYPPVSMTPDELNELVILRTDIHNAAKEQFAQWVVNGGIERDYEAFVRRLNSMGLQKMVTIYQGAYDRYTGKK